MNKFEYVWEGILYSEVQDLFRGEAGEYSGGLGWGPVWCGPLPLREKKSKPDTTENITSSNFVGERKFGISEEHLEVFIRSNLLYLSKLRTCEVVRLAQNICTVSAWAAPSTGAAAIFTPTASLLISARIKQYKVMKMFFVPSGRFKGGRRRGGGAIVFHFHTVFELPCDI